MIESLGFLLTHFTYAALVLLMLAAGLGLPMSEDLVLLVVGYLARTGIVDPWVTLFLGYGSVIAGDWMIFRMGRRFGPALTTHPLTQRMFPPRRLARLEAHYARWGTLTVVVARHVAGLRAPAFALAGAGKMSERRFLLADALSALVTTPLMVWLGYAFGDRMESLFGNVRQVQWVLLGGLAATLLVAGAARWMRRRPVAAVPATAAVDENPEAGKAKAA
ncbi:DedA family protein [Vulgatibacter sp.]|uniref:DedA family protein n=1 Tax=Vulgatibacter sp. TaxID=1971226 RepID=UPI00356B2877